MDCNGVWSAGGKFTNRATGISFPAAVAPVTGMVELTRTNIERMDLGKNDPFYSRFRPSGSPIQPVNRELTAIMRKRYAAA